MTLAGALRGAAAKALAGARTNVAGRQSAAFSTSGRNLAVAKVRKSTSDAKVAFGTFLFLYASYYIGTNMRELVRDYFPYDFIMEEHYVHQQRLKREAEAAKDS